jgi:hypothetical protein
MASPPQAENTATPPPVLTVVGRAVPVVSALVASRLKNRFMLFQNVAICRFIQNRQSYDNLNAVNYLTVFTPAVSYALKMNKISEALMPNANEPLQKYNRILQNPNAVGCIVAHVGTTW